MTVRVLGNIINNTKMIEVSDGSMLLLTYFKMIMSQKTIIMKNVQNYVILNIKKEASYMNNAEIKTILEQINNLKSPSVEQKTDDDSNKALKNVLAGVSEEIQRVMDVNDFTQEDLCRITDMSQSNISKILNGKVVPKIETLQKIAEATHTKLVISFEHLDGDY